MHPVYFAAQLFPCNLTDPNVMCTGSIAFFCACAIYCTCRPMLVVLKLGTAVPLGSLKQFQGDRKEVANLRISDKLSQSIVLDCTVHLRT